MTAEEITAVATVVLAVATLGMAVPTIVIAVAAWKQLPLIAGQVRALADQIKLSREAERNAERRQREWETVRACERYDVDPVLEAISSRLWDASDGGTNYAKEGVNQRDLICLLNYFDSLAIGIVQGLYIDAIVKDHLGLVIPKCVEQFILAGLVDSDGYENLMQVYENWRPAPPPPVAYRRD